MPADPFCRQSWDFSSIRVTPRGPHRRLRRSSEMAEAPPAQTSDHAADDPSALNDLSNEPSKNACVAPGVLSALPMSAPITPDGPVRESATRAGARLAATTLLLLLLSVTAP